MEWSNERILEFIAEYESEPVIWNPQEPHHMKKQLNYEAWLRIKNSLSWHVTVDELKNKMKSLMAYYRTHLNKYKKSLEAGAGKDDIYQTKWFAFSALHGFLAPVYDCPQIVYTEIKDENDRTNSTRSEERESIDKGVSVERGPKLGVGQKRKRDDVIAKILDGQQEIPETSGVSLNDDYEMFGKLIASKIRKLSKHSTREIVMNDIHNLIFRARMMELGQKSVSLLKETMNS